MAALNCAIVGPLGREHFSEEYCNDADERLVEMTIRKPRQ
jgi:hypothetical protein